MKKAKLFVRLSVSWGGRCFSCDIQECSGGHPEWHIKGDVLSLLNGNCEFTTMDGKVHKVEGQWDLIIAHPPCTYLTVAGTRHYSLRCNSPEKVAERIKQREEAYDFFMHFVHANCKHIAIENPVGYMNTHYRKPDQIIHPYYFVTSKDDESYEMKRTCLWLKGLPLLERRNDFDKPEAKYYLHNGQRVNWCDAQGGKNQAERAKNRSKTFPSIAQAMAETWYNYLMEENNERKSRTN